MPGLTAGLAIASTLGGLFGKKKKAPAAPVDPAISGGWSASNIEPILAQLFASADHSQQQQWEQMNQQLADQYQARGLGGSGIEFSAQSQHLRKLLADVQAEKQRRALEAYMASLQKLQSDRGWALGQYGQQMDFYNQQAQRNQGVDQGLGSVLGQLYGGLQQGKMPAAGGTPLQGNIGGIPMNMQYTPAGTSDYSFGGSGGFGGSTAGIGRRPVTRYPWE